MKVIWSFTKPQKNAFQTYNDHNDNSSTNTVYLLFHIFFAHLADDVKKEMTSSNYYFFNKKLKLPVYTI